MTWMEFVPLVLAGLAVGVLPGLGIATSVFAEISLRTAWPRIWRLTKSTISPRCWRIPERNLLTEAETWPTPWRGGA
jgi:hypothetical protein